MKKFIPCNKCDDGFFYDGDYAIKCECLKKYQKEETIKYIKSIAGIKDFNLDFDSYKGKDLQNNISKLKLYCSKLTSDFKNGTHLYLTGKNGTQKTTCAKIIISKAIEQGLTAKFVIMKKLVDILTDSFSENPQRTQELYSLKNVDLLVIDDAFDKKKVVLYKSGYQVPFIDNFLRERLETERLNTIFTSNVFIDNISENGFGDDIQNLITRQIKIRDAELLFLDVYVDQENDIDVKSIWD
jgi:DNA replication protein DnaC